VFLNLCRDIVGVECHYGTCGGNLFFDQICSRLLDVFVCDFMIIFKICERDASQMYCDNHSCYRSCFHALINFVHEIISFQLDYKSKLKNKSLSFWVCKTTYLDHICTLDVDISFCYNTYVWRSYGICTMIMCKNH